MSNEERRWVEFLDAIQRNEQAAARQTRRQWWVSVGWSAAIVALLLSLALVLSRRPGIQP